MRAKIVRVAKSPRKAAIGLATLSGLIRHRGTRTTTNEINIPKEFILNLIVKF